MTTVVPSFDPSQIVFDELRTELLIRTLIKDMRTAMPVKVVAVHAGSGSPPSIGTVDVQPLVQTVDNSGKLWSLGVTYGAAFNRVQSGSVALILDPAVNDIGLATVCDRDISGVLASGALSGPGSSRTHDISDLVYQFSIYRASAVAQYLQLTATLLKAVFPDINLNGVTIDSGGTLVAPALQAQNGVSDTVTVDGHTFTFEAGICTSLT